MNVQQLHQSVTIYVPAQLAGTAEVGAETRWLTDLAGGCTMERAVGTWIDDAGEVHMDDVLKMTWWFTEAQKIQAYKYATDIVLALRKAGEMAVFVERTDEAGRKTAAIHSGEIHEAQEAHA